MPLLLLAFFIVDLLSVAYLFVGYYLWRQWYELRGTVEDDYATRCLYGAIALLLFITLGKFLVILLLSKRKSGEDEPHFLKSSRRDILKRPEGNSINIEYYGNQDAQPIIFVHGWNANMQEWYYQIRHFERNYNLIMIDLPGLGRSTRPDNKNFSLGKMAHDLNAVIGYTGAKNPILWGHSIGGMVILTLLTRNKESLTQPVKGIILQHTTYTNPVKTTLFNKVMTALQKPVLTPLCYMLIGLSPLIWVSRWMSYLNGNSHIMSRWLTFAGTQTRKQLDFVTLLSTLAPPAVTARGVLGMFKYDVTQHLSTIRTPALIIAANKDRLTRPAASEYMKENIPNAELVTVAPAGHQGLAERYREVNEAAERFMQHIEQG